MILALSSSLAVFASSSTDKDVSSSLLQIRMLYPINGVKVPIQGGTSFLINNNTVLTCEHVITPDSDTVALLKNLDENYDKSKFSYEVVVRADVTIPATVKKASEKYDCAIVTLNEAIGNRTIAKLAPNASVDKKQNVYAYGFPQAVAAIQNESTYTYEDVTITSGVVEKLTDYTLNADLGPVKVIQHGAAITSGNSGGPLVDENDAVLGINEAALSGYNYAIQIKQVTDILDDLQIEWTEAPDLNGGNNGGGKNDSDSTQEATVEPETKPVILTPSIDTNSSDIGKTSDFPMWIIFVAIGVLVIALVVIVVIIIVLNGKKKNNTPVGPGPGPVPGPIDYRQGGTVMPPADPIPPVPYNEGSEGTSVLSGDSAPTSVLNSGMGGMSSFTMIRKSNGEAVNINKSRFVIGKERRKVDYCIADNSSVSRTHAAIQIRGGRCYITDLGSTNCTYVNGSKVNPNDEVVLSKGDKIVISDEEFEFIG